MDMNHEYGQIIPASAGFLEKKDRELIGLLAMNTEYQPIMPKMSGYLEKKGRKNMLSCFKKHWFVLQGRLLLYYKSKYEYEDLSPCKGSISLGPTCTIKPGSSNTGIFQIESKTTTITLKAENREEQHKWMEALMSALNQKNDFKKLSHFRYSMEESPTIHNKPVLRSTNSDESQQMIDKIKKIGAKSYVQPKLQKQISFSEESIRPNIVHGKTDQSFRKSESVMTVNEEYGQFDYIRRVNSMESVEVSSEGIYEIIPSDHSVCTQGRNNFENRILREEDAYSVPYKHDTKIIIPKNTSLCKPKKSIPNEEDVYSVPNKDNFENRILREEDAYSVPYKDDTKIIIPKNTFLCKPKKSIPNEEDVYSVPNKDNFENRILREEDAYSVPYKDDTKSIIPKNTFLCKPKKSIPNEEDVYSVPNKNETKIIIPKNTFPCKPKKTIPNEEVVYSVPHKHDFTSASQVMDCGQMTNENVAYDTLNHEPVDLDRTQMIYYDALNHEPVDLDRTQIYYDALNHKPVDLDRIQIQPYENVSYDTLNHDLEPVHRLDNTQNKSRRSTASTEEDTYANTREVFDRDSHNNRTSYCITDNEMYWNKCDNQNVECFCDNIDYNDNNLQPNKRKILFVKSQNDENVFYAKPEVNQNRNTGHSPVGYARVLEDDDQIRKASSSDGYAAVTDLTENENTCNSGGYAALIEDEVENRNTGNSGGYAALTEGTPIVEDGYADIGQDACAGIAQDEYAELDDVRKCSTASEESNEDKGKKRFRFGKKHKTEKEKDKKKKKIQKSESFLQRVWNKKSKQKSKKDISVASEHVVKKIQVTDPAVAKETLVELADIMIKKSSIKSLNKKHVARSASEEERKVESEICTTDMYGYTQPIDQATEAHEQTDPTMPARNGTSTLPRLPKSQPPAVPMKTKKKLVPVAAVTLDDIVNDLNKKSVIKKQSSTESHTDNEDIQNKEAGKVRKLIKRFSIGKEEGVELRQKNNWKPNCIGDSNDLDILLDELAKITTAPLMTPGVTTSLINPDISDKEMLKMAPIRRRRPSDPDYDIPRPHRSLTNIPKKDDNALEATRFFGPVLKPTDFEINPANRPRTPPVDYHSNLPSITPDSLEVESRRTKLSHDDLRKTSYDSHDYLSYNKGSHHNLNLLVENHSYADPRLIFKSKNDFSLYPQGRHFYPLEDPDNRFIDSLEP